MPLTKLSVIFSLILIKNVTSHKKHFRLLVHHEALIYND